MMAARAKARLDQSGAVTVGGTPNALTATTNQVLSAAHLTVGLRLMFSLISTNTSTTVTLAVDGLTPCPVKRSDGSALAVGSLRAGMFLDVVFTGASDWRCVNVPPVGTGFAGSSLASFSAYSASGQNVVNTSVNTLSIDTETYDIGSYFAPPSWTPPAGTVFMTGTVSFSSVTSGSTIIAALYKDGSQVAASQAVAGAAAGAISVVVQYMGQTLGSSVFGLRVQSTDANYTIGAGSSTTYFMGTMV
jgi:hypothetical protein